MSEWADLLLDASAARNNLWHVGSRAEKLAKQTRPGNAEHRRLVDNAEVAGRWLKGTDVAHLDLLIGMLQELIRYELEEEE